MRLSTRWALRPMPLALALSAAAVMATAAGAQEAPIGNASAAARGEAGALNPRERSVLQALDTFEKAVLAGDTVTLKRVWADEYTFINAQGTLVTRAQRLKNFASGATNVAEALNRRQITVRVYGDNAVIRQLFTLRGRYSGRVTDTELWCSFVFVWRAGRWQMVFNQLTPVAK